MSELTPLAWRLRRCLLSVGRDRLQLAEVWSCFLTCAPELLTARDRRARLRRTLDELEAASWLTLPTDAGAWDRRDPPLPRVVTVPPATERATQLGVARAEQWVPQLAWAADVEATSPHLADLVRINRWLLDGTDDAVIVPPRERALQLFGAGREARLHELAATDLWGPRRLSWDLLCCAPVPPPFVWSRVGPGPCLLVISGHETFASMRRTLVDAPSTSIGVVAHGAGSYFTSSVLFARTLQRDIDRILFYGDLDADDLDTARRADQRAAAAQLPPVEPATPLFELLLAHGDPAASPPLPLDRARALAAWLPRHLQDPATRLLVGGRRLPQEWVGYEVLVRERVWERIGAP